MKIVKKAPLRNDVIDNVFLTLDDILPKISFLIMFDELEINRKYAFSSRISERKHQV